MYNMYNTGRAAAASDNKSDRMRASAGGGDKRKWGQHKNFFIQKAVFQGKKIPFTNNYVDYLIFMNYKIFNIYFLDWYLRIFKFK